MAATYEIVVALADALAGAGMRHVTISPGSRSTPLAITFARHPAIRHWIHHDERSAAFFALGIAKTTGYPAGVITTSGTATAELYPAVIEARFGRAPLVLLTADRPPALRGTGANQTIDQVALYGNNVKWFHDAPLPSDTSPDETAELARRAMEAATTSPAGPVHLNLPFAEPLIPQGSPPAATVDGVPPATTRPGPGLSDAAVSDLAERLSAQRSLIAVGPHGSPRQTDAVVALAAASGAPILADPLSGLRAGPHDRSHVIGHYDSLAQAGFFDAEPPDAIIRLGPAPVSKALNTWIAAHPAVDYTIVDTMPWADAGGTARSVFKADPAAAAGQLAGLVTDGPAEWMARWRLADSTAAAALHDASSPFTELDLVAAVLDAAPDPATIWVGSSMPVRQVDLLMGPTPRRLRILGNRGASGIDGLVSAALGSAAASGEETIALLGDLSLLYDLTALAWAGRDRPDVTLVVANNDGGGIFHLLPQAPLPEFEELFGTPHGLDFSHAAALFDIPYHLIGGRDDLADVLRRPASGPRLIEARFERSAGATAYRAAVDRVRAALATDN
ncbi:MAG: 2-succinyl-5-enolpyruvyl-6-hydroxy-3-cyclohexene-1-carboxylic-acid synthase [Acidimicrobiia bacterium]|nr:2-succinyl-5-enolpyruvyl-6-hydroxy-3-cyclohexene-1-carboxylic-acid synthase [Acidimicrobiia bacterium]MBT8215879.1 2-succinyl-5-enolpyruvyl-6-hydroxy-3-cyclohexene-1-carboxylic-acid synthase [Acidimicrobiia bacterium]NNF09195.1 2-succinyl-5-enolpyruvyl-6-hydroxy-3-cyclohexene-1-carboxylic-acid synthase [Acidimicrobiia bacterium]NNL71118.1 2-succinyl-5-enolpyruvyl-6-hydroxy-3-cyclohexene-1-carboxylic-acid synthase [Acidimicrobiia bacterium]